MSTASDDAKAESFIISRTEEGFRVYAPAKPTESYVVSGNEENPSCTCTEFQHHHGDLQWRCAHIQAVLIQLHKSNGESDEPAITPVAGKGTPDPERGRSAKRPKKGRNGNDTPEMILKRSVSPDGRIDSLSVEFSCLVGKAPEEDIKATALTTLQLQDSIVRAFLNAHPKTSPRPQHGNGGASNHDAIPATLVRIGGMNGKWGRSLFLAIQADGQFLRVFGSRKRLKDILVDAGFAGYAEEITEGTALNLPCRIVTRAKENSAYLEIEKILPAEPPPAEGKRLP